MAQIESPRDIPKAENATDAQTLKAATAANQATGATDAAAGLQAKGDQDSTDNNDTAADAGGSGNAAADRSSASGAGGGNDASTIIVPHAAVLTDPNPPAIGLAVAAVVAPPIAADNAVADQLPEAAQLALARNIEKHVAPDGTAKAPSPQGQSAAPSVDGSANGQPLSSGPAVDGTTDGKSHPDSEAASNGAHHLAADLAAKVDLNAPSSKPGDAAGAVKLGSEAVQNLGLSAPGSQPNASINSAAAAMSANAPAPAQPVAVPMAGLAVAIAAQAQAGKHRFDIRLDPPDLGRIDVRLDIDHDGRVTSHLVADRSDTLDLLKRDAAQLERALQQAGLKTSDNALEFSLRQQSLARDDSTPPRTAPPLIVPDDDPSPLEALRQGYGRLIGLGGGLDIRV